MTLTQKLEKMGLELPEVALPVAAYTPALITGGAVRTSGQLPFVGGELAYRGACGSGEVTLVEAQRAAKQCALNALAAAAAVAGGPERIGAPVKVTGFVSSTADFFDQPQVLNGASEFFQELFGVPHIRSAVGVAALPLNATVEIEVEFALVAS